MRAHIFQLTCMFQSMHAFYFSLCVVIMKNEESCKQNQRWQDSDYSQDMYCLDVMLLRNNTNKSEVLNGQHTAKRCGRRIQKNVCYSPTDPYSGMLTTGIGNFRHSDSWIYISMSMLYCRELTVK